MPGCPNDEVLAALTEGRLSEREAAELHEHVDGCQSCQWLLRELAASHDPPAQREAASDAPIVFAPGAVLGERYRLERRLGSGGMGTVWSALHVGTERRVALKILRRERDPAPAARLRFLREARLLGRVDHPNLVPVRDVFEERGVPILALDLLDGESLGDRLRREGKVPLDELARLLLGALAAIEAAHAAGIVHRDLKPDNLFLVNAPDGGGLRVLDFGVAKLLGAGESVPELTAAGEVLGTPPYMAPEQLRGEPIDRRADVWAFGVILYECLSGRRPFTGERFAHYFERITSGTRAPLAAVAPDLPRDVLELVERMLTVDVRARPADLKECSAILRRHTREARDAVERAARRRRRAALAAGALIAAVAATAWIRAAREPLAPPSAVAKPSPSPAPPAEPPRAVGKPAPSPAPPAEPPRAVSPREAAPPPGSACEQAWGAQLGADLCHAPLPAMREAAYRIGYQLRSEGASEPRRSRLDGERQALTAALLACRGAQPCLLARLQAADSKTSVVDCERAVSRDAKAICRSAPLAALAGSLAAHYQVDREHYAQEHLRLERAPGGGYTLRRESGRAARSIPAPQTLSSDQTAWLIARHRCGDDEPCLTRLFEDRIAALAAIHRAFTSGGSDGAPAN